MEPTKLKKLSVSVPIIPIPFDANEVIDEEALRQLVQFAVDKNFCAICLPAYGSEFYKLTEAERIRVVKIAVQQAAGRINVIAQSNHGSAIKALELARTHVDNGADMISIALPRMFAITDFDLLRYLRPILNGVEVPSLVQDFSPAGGTIGADFTARLLDECPRFRYLKMEEPMLAPKLAASKLRRLSRLRPRLGIVLGSGFNSCLDSMQIETSIPYSKLPGFPKVSIAGHAGQLALGTLGDQPVAVAVQVSGLALEDLAQGAREHPAVDAVAPGRPLGRGGDVHRLAYPSSRIPPLPDLRPAASPSISPILLSALRTD